MVAALVSVEWLSAHLDDPDLVVLDCTNFAEFDTKTGKYNTISGRKNWAKDHITGSQFADFTDGLSGDCKLYRNTLPDPQHFATALTKLGVGDETRVVLYDTGASMWAARVWWMLRWIGFDKVTVLDGGLAQWKASRGKTTSQFCTPRPRELTAHMRPKIFVTKDDVKASLEDGSTLIIDALSKGQYAGSDSDLGICGHISGAINIPATSLIDPKTGLYYPLEKLACSFPQDRSRPTIIYCGSGIAAASVAYTMHRLGFDNIAIYMPGLQEWMSGTNLPLTNGPKE